MTDKFNELPVEAYRIAYELWTEIKNTTNPINALTRELDTSTCFREAIGVDESDSYPQEVDIVTRHFREVLNNEGNKT